MSATTHLRRAGAATVASASLMALAACGAGSRTGADTATQVACDYTPPAGATTVNVLAYNSSAIDPFTNTMVKSCTRDKVTLKHDPIDFGGQVTKTTATLAGDSGSYDIIETYGFVIAGLGAEGKVEPLDDLFTKHAEKYKLGEINEAMREGLSYDGKLYGLPMQAQMFTLAYRKDVFDKLQLTPPTTFEEMRTAAQKIADSGEMKYPLALPLLATADIATHYQAILNSLGKDLTDESGTPQFDTPEAKQALEELVSLKPFMDPQVTTFDQPKVQQQMFNGTAAMAVMFSGRMNDLTLTTNTKFADKFAFAAPPKVAADSEFLYSRLSIDGWSLPKNTKLDKDMLFQMMAASVSEEASKASVPAAYPAREGMVTEQNSKYGKAANESIAKTMPPRGFPFSPAITNAVRPVITEVMNGKVSVGEATGRMQQLAEAVPTS